MVVKTWSTDIDLIRMPVGQTWPIHGVVSIFGARALGYPYWLCRHVRIVTVAWSASTEINPDTHIHTHTHKCVVLIPHHSRREWAIDSERVRDQLWSNPRMHFTSGSISPCLPSTAHSMCLHRWTLSIFIFNLNPSHNKAFVRRLQTSSHLTTSLLFIKS